MMTTFDLPFWLSLAVIFTGIIWIIDFLFFAKKRKQQTPPQKNPFWVEYAGSFFPVLLLVLVIRSFLIQPYRVPTGSLEPTVLPGDLIAVNQFAYGLRLPVFNTKFLPIGEPKRGDIVVFRWPPNPKVDFVKRVIGLPGDHLVYQDKVLTINGEKAKQTYVGKGTDYEDDGDLSVDVYQEKLGKVKHNILLNNNSPYNQDFDITVPAGHYFMMGDNRDNSADSRSWGFVPEANLIGKGFIVWLSWDSTKHSLRWHRIGTVL